MKQIFKNRYIKSLCFSSPNEREIFSKRQNAKIVLSFDETLGDLYYCYACIDSLTGEKLFIITFDSYEKEDDLSLLFWDEAGILVVDTGSKIYFVGENLTIKSSFDITTPLIGLHLTNENKILLLEETLFKLINSDGLIVKQDTFDLAVDFKITHDRLIVMTESKNQEFLLG